MCINVHRLLCRWLRYQVGRQDICGSVLFTERVDSSSKLRAQSNRVFRVAGRSRDFDSTQRSGNRWSVDGVTSALASRTLSGAVSVLKCRLLSLMVAQGSA